MIWLLIVVSVVTLGMFVENVFLRDQVHGLIVERNAGETVEIEVDVDLVSVIGPVVTELVAHRRHQISRGWTPEHDDRHSTHRMVEIADGLIHAPRRGAPYTRAGLLKGAAVLVAAIESMDRRGADLVAAIESMDRRVAEKQASQKRTTR